VLPLFLFVGPASQAAVAPSGPLPVRVSAGAVGVPQQPHSCLCCLCFWHVGQTPSSLPSRQDRILQTHRL